MTNILLVDDHPAVREGTKNMIEENTGMCVVTASSLDEVIDLQDKNKFDLFIFDLFLEESTGLDLTKEVLSKDPDAIILIISGYSIEPHFNILVQSGVSGFISKTSSREQLISSIKCALRKEVTLPVSLFRQLRRNEASVQGSEGRVLKNTSLSTAEQDVLYEASIGKTNKVIAQTLLMSQRMVEYHLTRIFVKLDVKARGDAISKARELNLIPEKRLTID